MTDYITSTSLKTTLEIDSATYADADIATAITGASRAIDDYKQTRFYPTTETRHYTADSIYQCSIDIYDLNASTAETVSVDVNGDGTYGTAWVNGTDYYLNPADAELTGKPYNQLVIRAQSGRVFPTWQRGIQIRGSFGWSTAPMQVTQAATILAARYLKRARETPYGILQVVGDGITAARLGKIDPDVAFLLDNLGGSVPQLIA